MDKNKIKYRSILQGYVDDISTSYRVSGIDDPNQTHAVYGVPNDEQSIEELKSYLKSKGALSLRKVVANNRKLVILCFDAQRMIEDFVQYTSYR